MTLQQLQYVVAVADHGSMNKAAQAVFISQSSLSAGVQNLEEELGFQIFERSNRGVTVTPQGAEFLVHARQLMNQYQLTHEKFIDKRQIKKHFSVSAQHYSFAVQAFINVAKQFSIDEYAFGIHECKTAEVIQHVRDYKSELGVLYLDDFNRTFMQKLLRDNELEFTPLFDTKTYAYIARTHPLAERKRLKLEDLAPYPCLAFDQGSDEALYLAEEVYSTHHYRQQIRASDRATMLNLMAGLNGYTLCSGIISQDLMDDAYCVIPLDSDKIMTIGYLKRKGHALSELGLLYVDELLKSQGDVLHSS